MIDFKIVEEGHLALGRITVLIGPNGAGKSSFIQALHLLKQSEGQAALNCNGRLVSLGGFDDICRVGSKEITIELALEVPVDEIYGQESLTFLYSQTFTNSAVSRGFVELQLSPQAYLIRLEMDEAGAEEASSTVHIPLSNLRFNRAVLGLPSVSIIDPELRHAWTKATLAFADFFRSFQAMHSIRGFTHPEYPLSDRVDDIRDDPGKSASTIAYHRRLEQPMSEMLSRILGSEVVVRADLKSGRNVSIEIEDRVHRGNVVNEGFGVNRLLEGPLLELLLAAQGALVAIEEPEAHLHPLAQLALGRVLAEIAQQQDKQLLLTTHSEHILASLLTLVAEGKLNPSDLCIHYLERKGDRATVERLEVDELGRVKGGLRGFFETGVSELRTYYEALDRERRDDET